MHTSTLRRNCAGRKQKMSPKKVGANISRQKKENHSPSLNLKVVQSLLQTAWNTDGESGLMREARRWRTHAGYSGVHLLALLTLAWNENPTLLGRLFGVCR